MAEGLWWLLLWVAAGWWKGWIVSLAARPQWQLLLFGAAVTAHAKQHCCGTLLKLEIPAPLLEMAPSRKWPWVSSHYLYIL